MKRTLFVITAASATGKTSCIKRLCALDKRLVQSVSHSTRSMRPGEKNGVDKYFVSDEDFDALLAEKQLVEHTSIFGHRCGHTKASIEQISDAGNDILMVLNYQGLRMIKAQYPNTVSIFLLPPNLEAISDRIYQRPEAEGEDVRARIGSAITEMQDYAHYDYLVFNDQIEDAVKDIHTIVMAERLRTRQQSVRYAETIERLIGK